MDIENQIAKILKNLKINTIPINLKAIAKHYGILISEAPNADNLSGLLLKNDGKTIIGINSLHNNNRKRFTIAHEFGHYFLHQNKDTFVDQHDNLELLKFRHKSLPQTKEEREANSFAASLLMPSKKLKAHFNALKEIMNNPEEVLDFLSKKYEVSTEAMRYRLINLSLIKN